MNRIEMYNTIKKNGWAEEFKEKYNKNFTQGKNTELEEFVNLKSKPKVRPSTTNTKVGKKVKKKVEEEIYVNKVAFIELISILQSEACIKGKDAERILKLI